MSGKKIIDGMKDAVAGNFSAVTIDGQRWIRQDDDTPVEAWHGERKVSVYKNEVLRVWGTNIDSEITCEPRSLASVQAAFDWLYRV